MASAIGSFFGGPIGGAIGSLIDGKVKSDSAKRAVNKQAEAAKNDLALRREMFDIQNEQGAPARSLGYGAMNQLATLLGIQPVASEGDAPGLDSDPSSAQFGSLMRPFQYGDMNRDPGYQFRLGEGLKAINSNAGARGQYYSGATLKALQDYGQGSASAEYMNAFNRDAAMKDRSVNYLTSAAGMGSNAAGRTQSAAQDYASGAGSVMRGLGDVQAASTIGRGNVWSDTINNVFAQGQKNDWWGLFGKKADPDKPYWE